MTLLFYENGHVLESDLTRFKSLEDYENKLLSSDFRLYFENNINRLFPIYNIKDDLLITQSIQGGGTYEKHVQTILYKIIDSDNIRLNKTFGLKIIKQDKIFKFKRFDKKPKLEYWLEL